MAKHTVSNSAKQTTRHERITKPKDGRDVVWTPGENRRGYSLWTGWVPVGLLINTPNNPEGRQDITSRKYDMPNLMQSILRCDGPIMPIVCRGKPGQQFYDIEEGNRRDVTTLAAFGADKLVQVTLIDCPPNTIFKEVNSESPAKPIAGDDKLVLFYNGCFDKLCTKELRLFSLMESVIGRETVGLMVEANLTRGAYLQARRLASYCDYDKSNSFISLALRWTIRHRATALVEFPILRHKTIAATAVIEAVLNNEPLYATSPQTKVAGTIKTKVSFSA